MPTGGPDACFTRPHFSWQAAEDLLIDLFHKLATAAKDVHDNTEAVEWGTSSMARYPARLEKLADSIKLISKRAVATETDYLCEVPADKSAFGRIRLWIRREEVRPRRRAPHAAPWPGAKVARQLVVLPMSLFVGRAVSLVPLIAPAAVREDWRHGGGARRAGAGAPPPL